MSSRLFMTRDEHVVEIVLNRPEKLNALDLEAFDELVETGLQLKEDPTVRAIILRGEGGNFCAGLDLASFTGELSDKARFSSMALRLEPGQVANRFQRPALLWREMDVPVIAVLEGVVFGGGCQIALGADMRIASAGARLAVMEMKWGLIPDMGITQTLLSQVRLDVAKELVLTGRIVEAEEALAIGLLTQVVDDPLSVARTLAHRIAGNSPDAVRRAKRLLESAQHLDMAAALQLEAMLQSEVIAEPNQREAVMANLEKREPRFN